MGFVTHFNKSNLSLVPSQFVDILSNYDNKKNDLKKIALPILDHFLKTIKINKY